MVKILVLYYTNIRPVPQPPKYCFLEKWRLLIFGSLALIILLVHPLLGNVMVIKFPQRQILGKQSVARLCNNKGSCVFRVRGDVKRVDSDHVTRPTRQ
jgi:hypothetical protein